MAVEKKSEPKKTTKKVEKKNEFLEAAKMTKKVYDSFMEVGFTKNEAFELTKTMLKSPAMAPPKTSLF